MRVFTKFHMKTKLVQFLSHVPTIHSVTQNLTLLSHLQALSHVGPFRKLHKFPISPKVQHVLPVILKSGERGHNIQTDTRMATVKIMGT
jgi:hypothetical protein